MSSIANIITQILTYSDTVGTTDNPLLQSFNWSRRLSAVAVNNPDHKELRIPPGGTKILFDGLRTNTLNATSVVEISNISGALYKLAVTAGAIGGWRTLRSITGLSNVNITINNDSVATFELVGAVLTGIQSGDVLRVAGETTFDVAPYDFNPINSGLWVVIGVSGVKIQAVRSVDEPFSGIAEAVTGTDASQISVYSPDGVQKDDKFELSGAFSQASHKVYVVKDVTDKVIYFVSTSQIPEEIVNYPDPLVSGHSFVAYTSAKKLFYLETDQEVSVKFNDDSGDTVKISPIAAGNPDLIGYLHKFGSCYKVAVRNRSVNTAKVLYFVAE